MPVIKEVEKLWGRELWHHNDQQASDGPDGRGYCMKTLELRAGVQSSLHYHYVKRETFLVVAGEVELYLRVRLWNYLVVETISETLMTLRQGDSITIAPLVAHRFRALTPEATVVEASTPHDDADVYRLEESRLLP